MAIETRTTLDLLRADLIGGLRKPDALLQAYARHSRGEIDDAVLERVQEESVRDVIRKQEAHHLPVVTDGEFRRRQFQESFGEAVEGFDAISGREFYRGQVRQQEDESIPFRRVESGPSGNGPAVLYRRPTKSRLRLVRNVPLIEYQRASALTSTPVKVAIVGPDRVSQRIEWENSGGVYSGLDDFVEDVASI